MKAPPCMSGWRTRRIRRSQEREIRMGAIQDGMAQVLDGLRPGEQVVTAGSLFIDRAVTGD